MILNRYLLLNGQFKKIFQISIEINQGKFASLKQIFLMLSFV